jgi:predicted dinucleotide-binding enzyme
VRVGILGTGAMTRALGAKLVRAGHEVVIGSRDLDRARRLSESIGAVAGSEYREAAKSDVAFIAVRDTDF